MHTIERLHGAARRLLDPACLIDKFLDWVDELSDQIAIDVTHPDSSANGEADGLTAAP